MRVLVVEDHETLAGRLAQGLRQAGMAVDIVRDGAAALDAATQTGDDVIVLDRDLPVLHGDRVCRTLALRPANPDAHRRRRRPGPR
jgi:DNA-binding response OmpR family regulator